MGIAMGAPPAQPATSGWSAALNSRWLHAPCPGFQRTLEKFCVHYLAAMHLHFGSDDEGPAPAAPAAPAPQHAAFSAGPGFQCITSVRTDFDQKDQCYVFELAHSPGAGIVAAALSNRRIKLFNFR